jgi:hypothetical protein
MADAVASPGRPPLPSSCPISRTFVLREAIIQAWSRERGAGFLRTGSKNYCQSLINIEIPLNIEI